MAGDGNLIVVYAAYSIVALALTAWLARTLSHHGAVFLEDVFEERPGLAVAVNRLLVVGFYMLNLGYAFFTLRGSRGLETFEAVQFFINRVAQLLLVLGAMHFVNVFVFWRIRQRTAQRRLPAPTAPSLRLPGPPAPQE